MSYNPEVFSAPLGRVCTPDLARIQNVGISYHECYGLLSQRRQAYLQALPVVPKLQSLGMYEPCFSVDQAGAHLDDVDNAKIKTLWTRAKEYINKHGGQTTAGPSTPKKKYKTVLVEDIPDFLHDPKPCKTGRDHRAYEKFKVQGQDEASFDNSFKENKPTGKPGTRGGRSNRKNSDKLQCNHKEHTKYDVQGRREDSSDLSTAVSGGTVPQSNTRGSILTTL